jgi:hypothetical protein
MEYDASPPPEGFEMKGESDSDATMVAWAVIEGMGGGAIPIVLLVGITLPTINVQSSTCEESMQ